MTTVPKDRTKTPPGYELFYEAGTAVTDARAAGLGRFSMSQWSNVRNAREDTRRSAIAACWAHRNRITAEALREAAEALREALREAAQEQPSIDMLDVEDWLRTRADALDPPGE